MPCPAPLGIGRFARLPAVRYTIGMNADPSALHVDAGQVSPGVETQPDTAKYGLTVEDAASLFAKAGVPRSPRTIARFCQLEDLDCLRVETEKNFKWMVDERSAEKRIKELQQAIRFTSKTQPDMSSYVETVVETQPDMSRHDDIAQASSIDDEEREYLRSKVEELENDLMHARIDKMAKEQVINQMAAERREFIEQIRDTSFRLGEATAKVEQLAAPKVVETSHVPTDADAEPGGGQGTDPAPEVAPAKRRGLFSRFRN